MERRLVEEVLLGPIEVMPDITSSSRIGSIGGFVTWAKSCLK